MQKLTKSPLPHLLPLIPPSNARTCTKFSHDTDARSVGGPSPSSSSSLPTTSTSRNSFFSFTLLPFLFTNLPIYQKAGFFFFLFFFFCCCVHTCFTCVRLRLRVPKMKPSAAVSFSRPTLRDSRRVVDTTPFWGGRGAHNNRAPQKAYWVFYTNNNSNSNFYFFSTSSSSREREFVPHRSSFLLLSSSKQQKKMSTQPFGLGFFR